MKKMITLLLSVGLIATSYAQNNRQQNDSRYSTNDQYATASNGRVDNGNDRRFYDNRNAFSARERDFQIDRINREFNYKLMSIQNNPYMKNRHKKLAIRDAETQRAMQIQMLNAKFNSQFQKGYGKYDNGRR